MTADERLRACTQLVIAEIGASGPEDLEEALGRMIALFTQRTAAYYELLYAVAKKFPDETRHETALRYIRKCEEPSNSPAVEAKP